MTEASKAALGAKPAQAEKSARSPSAEAVDPFGLWRLAEPAASSGVEASDVDASASPHLRVSPSPRLPISPPGGAVSFSISGGNGSGDGLQASAPDEEVYVWTLSLVSGPGGSVAGEKELEKRAGQVRAITSGLSLATDRAEMLVSGHLHRVGAPEAGPVSFSIGPESGLEALPAPEAHLAFALSALALTGAGEEINFGLGEDLSRLAGKVRERLPGGQLAGVNWDALYQRLNVLMESVNQQLLHFAWVDTTLDGHLAARTTVNWSGDSTTLWQPGLSTEQCAAHCRSLELAMESRSANLRTIFTVSQIAGKIALAAGNPLLAMALAWQFVQEVVMPMLGKSDG